MKLTQISIILGILLIVVISGCTSDTGKTSSTGAQPGASQANTQSPTNLAMFAGVKEGDIMRFYFGFDDREAYDGAVSLKILDSANKTVYTRQFDVNAPQYLDYEFKLTGNPMGKAYEWKVPINDIQKGMSSMGTAYMIFTTKSGKTLNADSTLLELPAYTSAEIEQLYENQYVQTAKNIGGDISCGSFDITLVRVGYFTHLEYGTIGNEITDFRVDIEAKNTGSDKESLGTTNAKLIAGSNQYEYDFQSKFDGFEIYPGVEKDGYIIFKDVPEGLGGVVKIIVGSTWVSYNNIDCEFMIQM